jgi:hypothetical protein
MLVVQILGGFGNPAPRLMPHTSHWYQTFSTKASEERYRLAAGARLPAFERHSQAVGSTSLSPIELP